MASSRARDRRGNANNSTNPVPTGSANGCRRLGYASTGIPLCGQESGPKRPRELKIVGQHLVFFRDAETKSWHLPANVTPGSPFVSRRVALQGTLSCPYHGWTSDGKALPGVLEKGRSANSGSRAVRHVAIRRRDQGRRFRLMGTGTPAPIEEDVPPNFSATSTWS